MLDIVLPIFVAILIWWIGTGIVLLLDGLPRTTFRWSIAISSVLAAVAFWQLARLSQVTTTTAAYASFACAVLIWGWVELAFLTGLLTGPRKEPWTAARGDGSRFGQAFNAIFYHEVALLVIGLATIAAAWTAPNPVGAWTFVALWVMRTSAKFNLFLGVRNLGEEFLPPHLAYMASYFRRKPMNLLFPFSVTLPAAVAALLVQQAIDPAASEFTTVANLLVATLLAVAVFEHWMLVLPLPGTALWRWAMRRHDDVPGNQSVRP